MINNTNEFMSLSVDEKAEVITEMVKELTIETGYPIDICVAMIAEYKHWSRFQVEQYIKKYDPDLLYQVAFFIGEKRVYKYQIDKEVKEIIEDKLLNIVLEHPFQVSAVYIRKIIQEYCYLLGWDYVK